MSLAERAQSTLLERARELAEEGAYGADGRAARLEQNLIACLTEGQLREATAQIAEGAGGELRPQGVHPPPLHSAYGSAALALNCFGRWIGAEESLALGGQKGFDRLAFEQRCPIGGGCGTPNLDLVADGPGAIVGVESKCTEHLGAHRAEFKPAYRERMLQLAEASWRAQYEALVADAGRYAHLDAAQLVKHYLGLKNTFGSREGITLLYLYWEPTNAEDHEVVIDHRREVERFESAVDDPIVRFRSLSYPALWETWDARAAPEWLGRHVAELRGRYAVAVPAA